MGSIETSVIMALQLYKAWSPAIKREHLHVHQPIVTFVQVTLHQGNTYR